MDTLVRNERKQRLWQAPAWARDRWIEAHALKLPPGAYVLDAGAGASKYRPFFAHCRYETQDFCQYQGELVRYLKPIDHVCDIARIPLPDASLDAILCTEVLEHVLDPMAVLDEFHRLIKPKGKLLLTAPQNASVHMEPFHFYGGFTEFWYKHWLPVKGFQIESVDFQGGPGECAAGMLNTFYMTWIAREKELRGWRRVVSFSIRSLARIPIHYLPIRTLPRLDPWLGSAMNAGLMVAAVRIP